MLKDFLQSAKCFKLICGAGNEDIKEIEKLTALYAKAGCKFFDLSANLDVIDAAKRGLEFAKTEDAFICVSVGTKGDPHTSKAVVDYDRCISCYSCDSVCPNDAVKYGKVKKIRCIGCGKCVQICPKKAISLVDESRDLYEILPPIIEKRVDCIELHVSDENIAIERWEQLSKLYDGILSFCASRKKLGDDRYIDIIKKAVSGRIPYTTIIQADGNPMSGGKDDYKTTLQAVAAAELVKKENLPVFVFMSGGTNSKTAELAKICKVEYDGISVGSYARKIVKEYTAREDFLTNENVFNSALKIAQDLVKTCL